MERVCVYCGSSPGTDPAYRAAAREFAEEAVSRGVGIVYGGSREGVMGALADAGLDAGGEVIGVIPEALEEREPPHRGLTDLHVVESMHERKRRMADLSDGFVALPGGFGTAEEIFEAITWAQLGLHGDPCGFLNADEYFDPLVAFLDHVVEEGFARSEHRYMLTVESDPADLLDAFEAYEPPGTEQWIGPEET